MPVTNRAALAHPIPWVAAALLALNDHVLKARFDNVLTGKLSDVAWLALAPVLLAGILAPGGTAWRRRSVLLCGSFFVALQLWPPLGLWFSSHHVADVGDLLVLPALLLPWWVWRGRPRRDWGWLVVPPLLVPLLATSETELVGRRDNTTSPCADREEPWPTGRPLLIAASGVFDSTETDQFLRGISLWDEDGDVDVVVAEIDQGLLAVCAIDGLRPNTTYVWTLTPINEPAPSHQLPGGSLFATEVTFTTNDDPGVPVTLAADCGSDLDSWDFADECLTPEDTGA